MTKHWEELRDKGPPTSEPEYPHKKVQGGKKSFVIERRYFGPERRYFYWLEKQREWHVYRRYKTEKQRDQAYTNIAHKIKINRLVWKGWEFRIGV